MIRIKYNNMVKKYIKVILLRDIASLGKKGDVKNVSAGYALNFLLPQKFAAQGTADRIKKIENEKVKVEASISKVKDESAALLQKIKNVSIEISGKVSDGGKLFAAVGESQIIEALKKKKIEIEEKSLKIGKKIKDLGEHEVKVDLGNNLKTSFKIIIKGE